MVTTRQTTANAKAAANDSNTKPSTHAANETSRIILKRRKSANSLTLTADASVHVHGPPPPDSISEHNLSLTSPPQDHSLQSSTMNSPGHGVQNPVHHDPDPAPVRRVLAPKAHGVAGSVNNPISVLEDSPPRKSAHAPSIKTDRKSHKRQQLEPHKFVDNGYRKLYPYRQSRPAVVPQPANGTTFTGHKSHDIYRAMNARASTSAAGVRYTRVPVPVQQTVPFDVQFPMSSRFLTNRAISNPAFSAFAQSHGLKVPTALYAPSSAQSEEMLRRKAVQYVREYSRRTPRKRALSNADPDETSTSESEELAVGLRMSSAPTRPPVEVASTTPKLSVASTPKLATTPRLTLTPAPASTPALPSVVTPKPVATSASSAPTALSMRQKGKLSVYRDIAPRPATTKLQIPRNTNSIEINNLVQLTTLLSSLLTIYPRSIDQKGLREDIAMLTSVQNQRLEAWQSSEADVAKRYKKSVGSGNRGATLASANAMKASERDSSSGTMLRERGQENVNIVEKAREQGKDAHMRGMLSAGAGMWQDGSGVGVADVYAGKEGGEDESKRGRESVGPVVDDGEGACTEEEEEEDTSVKDKAGGKERGHEVDTEDVRYD
ncbi:hypothetical protein NX059_010126 [Plenodomus lindquistii]|nr:hypothetical protein NX059_010126 [Plenodomus lindquistii]